MVSLLLDPTAPTTRVTNMQSQRSIWAHGPIDNASFMDEYFRNSLERDSPEMKRICAAVKEAGVFVVLGYSERYRGTLYIAQVRACYSSWTHHCHGSRLLTTLSCAVLHRRERRHCSPPPQDQAHPRRTRLLRRRPRRESSDCRPQHQAP